MGCFNNYLLLTISVTPWLKAIISFVGPEFRKKWARQFVSALMASAGAWGWSLTASHTCLKMQMFHLQCFIFSETSCKCFFRQVGLPPSMVVSGSSNFLCSTAFPLESAFLGGRCEASYEPDWEVPECH